MDLGIESLKNVNPKIWYIFSSLTHGRFPSAGESHVDVLGMSKILAPDDTTHKEERLF
jgi:hypothetical protein